MTLWQNTIVVFQKSHKCDKDSDWIPLNLKCNFMQTLAAGQNEDREVCSIEVCLAKRAIDNLIAQCGGWASKPQRKANYKGGYVNKSFYLRSCYLKHDLSYCKDMSETMLEERYCSYSMGTFHHQKKESVLPICAFFIQDH